MTLRLQDAMNSALQTSNQNVPGLHAREPQETNLIAEYLQTLRRHRLAIVVCALIGLAVSFLVGLTEVPLYRTRTSLDIRTLNGDFMDMRSAAPTAGASLPADNDVNLQTQIRLLQSDTLLQAVNERLLSEPHPQTIGKGDLLSQVLRSFHLGGFETIPYTKLVAATAATVKVKPLGLTRLVEITCDSWDAKFSATYCNTLTRMFEEQDLQARATEASKTSQWLTAQAADIRQRAEDGQKRLEAAVGGNGLLLSTTPSSTGEDRLHSLQDELVKAQADRMAKEAQVDVTHTAAPETLPNVQDNPAYRAYELKLADLRAQVAALVPPLTELNPRVIHLRSEIADAEQGMRATQSNSTNREGNELAAARHREKLLQLTYTAQVGTVSSDLQKTAQVSLLRREVESEQQLYETLLTRAKEAGFASAMQAATIRVVDPAKTPLIPVSPRRKLAGGAGLALGSLFGMVSVFYKDRHHRVFRSPGDVERFLHLNELGTIPVAKRLRARPSSSGSLARLEALDGPLPQSDTIALTGWNDHFSLVAEAYRSVTFSILLQHSGHGGHSYVIASPNSGEGKTTVTTNLGIALSKSKLRVVLIDGDLRRPSLHTAFGIENSFGLRNVLRGEIDLETIPMQVLTHRTSVPFVSVIPAGEGSGDVDEMLHSPHFATLLDRLARECDIVLIDTPPMLHMADARILANQTSGVILVFRASRTMRDEAAAARDLFDHDNAHVVGSILNAFDPIIEGKSRYYESYYRYQTQETLGKAEHGA